MAKKVFKTAALIVYDLVAGNTTVVANPDGIASIGGKPGSASNARMLAANPNANTVAAIGFDAAGKQIGVVSFRIP